MDHSTELLFDSDISFGLIELLASNDCLCWPAGSSLFHAFHWTSHRCDEKMWTNSFTTTISNMWWQTDDKGLGRWDWPSSLNTVSCRLIWRAYGHAMSWLSALIAPTKLQTCHLSDWQQQAKASCRLKKQSKMAVVLRGANKQMPVAIFGRHVGIQTAKFHTHPLCIQLHFHTMESPRTWNCHSLSRKGKLWTWLFWSTLTRMECTTTNHLPTVLKQNLVILTVVWHAFSHLKQKNADIR